MDNKTFIEELALRSGLDIPQTCRLVESFRDVVADIASEGDSIAIASFGSFETRCRPERIVVHPATGNKMLVPPKISFIFKPSALLKQKIKQK